MPHVPFPRALPFAAALAAACAVGAERNAAPPPLKPAPAHDGQHDFDFEIGRWKTHVSRRLHPLTGSNEWVAYDGVSDVRKVWNGAANLLELGMDGSAGHFDGLSLRLYDPHTQQWSLNFANRAGGGVATPTVGAFRDGRGEFYDQETLDGRAIQVRFTITPENADRIRFEQAFSADGGKQWEVNWIAIDTRVAPAAP